MKSLRILIASSFLMTACTLAPEAPVVELPEEEATTRTMLYWVDLEDNGQNGTLIGCGDSLVGVPYVIADSGSLEETLQALLDAPKQDPETGFYNALGEQGLTVDAISRGGDDGSHLTVELSGDLMLGGACEAPRIEEQLKATVLQGEGSVDFYLNDIPLKDALSSQ